MKNSKVLKYFSAIWIAAAFMLFIPHICASAENVKNNILVYMIGSDLESKDEAATRNLKEMAEAAKGFGDDTDLIVYAGGTEEWHNDIFSSEENRCVRFDNNGAELLYAEKKRDMTEPETLGDFLHYCSVNCSADRNILILWDHGFGYKGFGLDELFDRKKFMSPIEIWHALDLGGLRLDIIGFDACIMANVVTASCLVDYSKYMVASEEMEPVNGWDYQAWLPLLAEKPDSDSLSICKMITDTYIECYKTSVPSIKATLSVIDLEKMKTNVPHVLSSFTKKMMDDLRTGKYDMAAVQKTMMAQMIRANRIDMIDAIEFLHGLQNREAGQLERALRTCIAYNRAFPEDIRMNGVMLHISADMETAIGINFRDLEYLRSAGLDENYLNWLSCMKQYMAMAKGLNGEKRTLMDVYMNVGKGKSKEPIYEAVIENSLNMSGCYIMLDENEFPQLVMPEEEKEHLMYVCMKMYREINGRTVDYGSVYLNPEDFPVKYSGFWKAMHDKWLWVDGVLCPFYVEEIVHLDSGKVAVYAYTDVYCDGEEGILFLRLLYDDANESVTVEPVCFQRIVLSDGEVMYGRIEPIADMDPESEISLCTTYTDEEGKLQIMKLTEEEKWGEIKDIEMRNSDEPENLSVRYFAVDLFNNMYPIEVK